MSVRLGQEIQEVPRSLSPKRREQLLAGIVVLNVLLYAFLTLTAYLAINHHEPLRRYGLTTLAAVLAPHPLRWALGAAVIGIGSVLIAWRLGRLPRR